MFAGHCGYLTDELQQSMPIRIRVSQTSQYSRTFDLSLPGFLVESFHVPLFADFQRRIDEALEERQTVVIVQGSRTLSVLRQTAYMIQTDCSNLYS